MDRLTTTGVTAMKQPTEAPERRSRSPKDNLPVLPVHFLRPVIKLTGCVHTRDEALRAMALL